MKRFTRHHPVVAPHADAPPDDPPNLDYYARPRRDRGPVDLPPSRLGTDLPVPAVPGEAGRERSSVLQ